MHKAEPLVY